ncbi:MAG: hypothetical protein HXY53_03500 [Nitrospirae bacterium]|nr:hypothetical protein [Nitrospirota bacterium]
MIKETIFKENHVSSLRVLSFIFNALAELKNDPVCKRCSTFAGSIDTAKEFFIDFERSIKRNSDLPGDFRKLLFDIYAILAELNTFGNLVEQKTMGKCQLPDDICFARAILEMYRNCEVGNIHMRKEKGEEVKYEQ